MSQDDARKKWEQDTANSFKLPTIPAYTPSSDLNGNVVNAITSSASAGATLGNSAPSAPQTSQDDNTWFSDAVGSAVNYATDAAQSAQNYINQQGGNDYYSTYSANPTYSTQSAASDKEWEDPTEREKLSAKRQKALSKYGAKSVRSQLNQRLANYDYANEQNAALRDAELIQAAQKADADRFQAQRNLRNAALGVMGAMGPEAFNSSSLDNLRFMLNDRNDADNVTYWRELQENRDMLNNAYQENYNANQLGKRDAVLTAQAALDEIAQNLAANLANIHPDLYEAPGKNKSLNKISDKIDAVLNKKSLAQGVPTRSGYIMPAVAEQLIRR